MFGGFGVGRILHKRDEYKDAATREVTYDEFIKLATESGMDRPEFHAKIAMNMGAAIGVGNEKLTIKREAKTPEAEESNQAH